jgi:glutamine synthetase
MRDYFGAKFQSLFATTRRGELRMFESYVSPLEYEWYVATS